MAVMVLLVAGICAGAWWIIAHREKDKGVDAPDLIASPHTKEIMVMGVDPRTDDTGRSDTLFIVSLDEEAKRASILSIPRDTRVEMEPGAYEKINHAYAYGGHEYSQNILERLLATKMDGYVIVNIRAFEKMIDAVGGVDIDVEKRMYYEDPWDEDGGLVIDLYPGEQHLDGKQAMEYVRFRDEEGDIGRIARQQKFLKALLARVTSPEVVPHLAQIVRELGSIVETDMEIGDMAHFAALLPDIKGNGIESSLLPGKPAWWQETSYWLPDIKEARRLLASQMGAAMTPAIKEKADRDAAFYEEHLPQGLADVDGTMRIAAPGVVSGGTGTVKPENIRVKVLNCSGIKGAAAASADVLRGRGFVIDNEDVGNGSTRDLQKTTFTVPKGTEALFRDLPFPCVIRTGDDNTAVLEIGKDYNNA
ncbi:MAG: LCP family protein [Schwartzia sp.]|nr:LCP family protein [Schwartzia sp. (in: firmicutes)]